MLFDCMLQRGNDSGYIGSAFMTVVDQHEHKGWGSGQRVGGWLGTPWWSVGDIQLKVGGRHGEVRWASSDFKEEGSSEKCPATIGN